ncbi:hypothetical protein LA635_1099 [Erwinia amylovora LA635]|nr:hypothetical protein LA635_1099 [Erwinia amylovora LA635]CDK18091.1 hypothetical protein LA636_1099 [Erwinia amylovora LA636]CDK21460.1 hypothetical protein LA637_1100 [Erwinia amylovora LA637]
MTSAAPCPLGRCRWQRCLTYVRPDLLQVRTLPGLRTAKRRLQAAFLHWWVVQDDFGCASPFGRCRWQRCLTYARPDLLQVRTLPGLRTAKRRLQAAFLHWWVVQDDFSCALPFGPLPLAALSHLRSTRPAAGSNPARFAHSKKAPLGRLSTLVGRAGFEPATN